MTRQPWFGRKRAGWGLRPTTWQGWALTGVYVLVVVLLAKTLAATQPWIFRTTLGAGTAVYILTAYLTSR